MCLSSVGSSPSPNDCGLVATGFQVTVDAVDGYVEFPALKPFDVEVAFAIAPILDLVPLLAPGQELISLLGPEAVLSRLWSACTSRRKLLHQCVQLAQLPWIRDKFCRQT